MKQDLLNAKSVLQPYFPGFEEVLINALKDYHKIPYLHKLKGLAKACILRDFCVEGLETKYKADKNISIHKRGLLFLICIGGKYLIRIKKLNNRLMARNTPTKQALNFSNQSSMFEETEIGKTVNLNLGYVMSVDWLEMKRIAIVCPDGNVVDWHIDINSAVTTEEMFAGTNEIETKVKVPNVRIKVTEGEKEMTNRSQ